MYRDLIKYVISYASHPSQSYIDLSVKVLANTPHSHSFIPLDLPSEVIYINFNTSNMNS